MKRFLGLFVCFAVLISLSLTIYNSSGEEQSLNTIKDDDTGNFIVAIDSSLSSIYSDYAPRFMDSNCQSLTFTSQRGQSVTNLDNIYYTTWQGKKWSTPFPLLSTNNGNIGVLTVDTKRNVLIYTRCPLSKNQGVHCQLSYSYINSDIKEQTFKIDVGTDNSEKESYTEGHPCFSNKFDLLFYVSNMPGGFGKNDIWYSKYDRATDTWGKPQNAGSGVNTSEDEMFPFIADDGTLYFSSKGHKGYGGLDIFKSNKIQNYKWDKAINMGKPINSEADDFGIVFKGATQSGYISSNRKGGIGSDDIYYFTKKTEQKIISSIQESKQSDSAHQAQKDALIEMFNTSECTYKNASLTITNSKIFPNPNTGNFTYQFNSNMNIQLSVRVYNSLGKIVYTKMLYANMGICNNSFDLASNPSGVYYLQLHDNCDVLENEKILIQH